MTSIGTPDGPGFMPTQDPQPWQDPGEQSFEDPYQPDPYSDQGGEADGDQSSEGYGDQSSEGYGDQGSEGYGDQSGDAYGDQSGEADGGSEDSYQCPEPLWRAGGGSRARAGRPSGVPSAATARRQLGEPTLDEADRVIELGALAMTSA